jgi:hypothetical protein
MLEGSKPIVETSSGSSSKEGVRDVKEHRSKKQDKKKASKTLTEKRAEKRAKKQGKMSG